MSENYAKLKYDNEYISVTYVDYTAYIDSHDIKPVKKVLEEYYAKACPEAKSINTIIFKRI